MLVVKMGSLQPVEAREFGFEPCFLHQPRIAGCDRFGHGKLIDLRSGVFEAADAAIAGHGHIDEPRLSLEHLPVRGVDACFGGVSVEFYLIILIALAFNATLALLNMRGKPADVEVMKSHEAALGVDACAHGLGRTNEDADAAGVEVGEELLFGGGLLVILHESDLGRRDAELDETGLDPTVGGKATRPLDIERAEVGKDHLSAATQSVGDAVRPAVAPIRSARPNRMDVIDHEIKFIAGFIFVIGEDESHVDTGMAAVGDD